MGEVRKWVRVELGLQVWQGPVKLKLISVLDRLILGHLSHIGTVEGHHGLRKIRHNHVFILNTREEIHGPLFELF